MPLLPKDVRVDVRSQRVVAWRSFMDENVFDISFVEKAMGLAVNSRIEAVELWTKTLQGFSAKDAPTLRRWAGLLEKNER